MSNNDYYQLRLEEELKAAEGAADPAIAQIHRDMAERYRELAATDPVLAKSAGGAFAQSRPAAA